MFSNNLYLSLYLNLEFLDEKDESQVRTSIIRIKVAFQISRLGININSYEIVSSAVITGFHLV